MQDSKLRSRLKAQLTKFCSELCEGLNRIRNCFPYERMAKLQVA